MLSCSASNTITPSTCWDGTNIVFDMGSSTGSRKVCNYFIAAFTALHILIPFVGSFVRKRSNQRAISRHGSTGVPLSEMWLWTQPRLSRGNGSERAGSWGAFSVVRCSSVSHRCALGLPCQLLCLGFHSSWILQFWHGGSRVAGECSCIKVAVGSARQLLPNTPLACLSNI